MKLLCLADLIALCISGSPEELLKKMYNPRYSRFNLSWWDIVFLKSSLNDSEKALPNSLVPTIVHLGFPGGSDSKESACNAGDLGSIPGLGRSHGGGHSNPPTPVFLPGEFHGQRSQTGYNPWGRKESDTTEQLITHCTFKPDLLHFIYSFNKYLPSFYYI